MPTTYAPATPEEVTTVMAAFYSKARIPTGFAVNLSWDPPVRRIVGGTPDPDELAAIRAARIVRGAELDAVTPGPGQVVTNIAGQMVPVKRDKIVTPRSALATMSRGLAKVLASYYFADDFERPDTTGSASTTNTGLGNGWQITGSGFLTGRINGGAYVNSGNTYVWRQLPFTPSAQSAVASWSGSSRAIVLIASPDANLFHNAVHTFFSPTQVLLQIRVANASTTLATIPLNIATDDVLHELAHEITGNTIIAYIDGVEVGRTTDARVGGLMGPYATYQIAGAASEPTTPRIEFVDAVKRIA